MDFSSKIMHAAPFGFSYHKFEYDETGKRIDFTFLDLNEAVEKITGFTRRQLLGKTVRQISEEMNGEQQKLIQEFARSVLNQEGEASEFYSPISQQWYQLQNWDEKDEHFFTAFTPVLSSSTSQKPTKDRHGAFKNLLDHIPHSIFLIEVLDGPRFRVKDFNDTQLTYLNMIRDDVQGKYVRDVFPEEVADKIITHYKDCLEAGQQISYEEDVVMPGRGRRVYFTTLSPIQDRDGNIEELIGSSIEITERKLAQEALAKSEEKYRGFVQNSSEGIYLFELAKPCNTSLPSIKQVEHFYKYGYVAASNDTLAQIYGLEKGEELVGKKLIDFHGSENDPKHIAFLQKFLESDYRIKNKVTEEIDKDGNTKYFNNNITGVTENGNLVRMWATQSDVTERISAEKKLQENEERLTATLRSIGDGVISCDRNGKVLGINKVAEKLTGRTSKESVGKPIEDVFHIISSKTGNKVTNPVEKALKEGITVGLGNHTILISKDGTEYQISDSCAPVRNPDDQVIGCVLVFRDVTDEYEQREDLKESESRFRSLAENVPGVIYLCKNDERYTMTFINDQVETLTGYHSDDFLEDRISFVELYHPDDKEEIFQKVETALAKRKPFQLTYRIKHKNSDWRWVMENGIGLYDETGNLTHLEGYLYDYTVQKEAELLAFKAAQQQSFHIENSPLAVIKSDENFNVVEWSKTAEKLFGWTEEEVLSKDPDKWVFTHEEDQEKVNEKIIELTEGKSHRNFSRNRNYTKDGRILYCEWYNSVMFDQDGNVASIFSLVHDISDLKTKEKELQESLTEKETLLSEIHHRVKNNLAVVSGMMQLQAYETEDETLQSKLFESVMRIKTMASVHELLYDSTSFSQLDFSETISKLVENISETLQNTTEISLIINTDQIKLNINKAIPASLIVNEVITNTYKHAFDNMEKGILEFSAEKNDEFITITVKDNGSGFDDEELPRPGSLGMHLIQGLSTQIDGEYRYENSNPGTKFTLRFPVD